MPSIKYIQSDGTSRIVEVPAGTTIMQAAVSHDVPGIVGECGGSGACATCHVYVAAEFFDSLPSISESEAEMLDFAASKREQNSRLGCQVAMTEALDGLVVRVPDTQV